MSEPGDAPGEGPHGPDDGPVVPGNGHGQGPVVQSVDRALALLEILAREGWSGVTEAANELGIHKSTAFRLLATLERRGLVEQHVATQKYRLGLAVTRLAGAVRSALDVTGSARPVCERLSDATGETVTVAVLEGGEAVYIDQVNTSSSLVTVNWLGRRTALHTTASGKVLLASLPPGIREDLLARPLEASTPHTVVDPAVLRRQLDTIRRDGYAVTLEELELGLNAVASPIRGPHGEAIATIAVSGPSYRVTSEQVDGLSRETTRAAGEVSRRLGSASDPLPTVAG